MALNLSRNTKVFVSSVNGVTRKWWRQLSFRWHYGGSGHAVGDVLTWYESTQWWIS